MERFGFVGLPNAGKSSLYNALAGGGALAAPYAFATTDPNVGVAKVPDHRLDAAGRDVQVQERRARHRAVRRHRRPGRGGQQGRGPGQQVPRPHPRGRRHRLRAAGLRRRRRARPVRPARAPAASSSSSWPSPTSRPSRTRSRSGARRPSRTSPWSTRSPPSTPPTGCLEAGTPLYRGDLAEGRERTLLSGTSCSPTSR